MLFKFFNLQYGFEYLLKQRLTVTVGPHELLYRPSKMGHIWTERDRINASNGHISNRGQGSNSLTCNVRLQVEAYPKDMILFKGKVTAVERVQIGSQGEHIE